MRRSWGTVAPLGSGLRERLGILERSRHEEVWARHGSHRPRTRTAAPPHSGQA